MRLARHFQEALQDGDEGTLHSLELAERTLGGPGSGWTAEGGHTPGSQGGKDRMSGKGNVLKYGDESKGSRTALERLGARADTSTDKANSINVLQQPREALKAHQQAYEHHKAAAAIASGREKKYYQDQAQHHQLTARNISIKSLAAAKIPQPVVLYMSSAENEKDFTCGGCSFATPEADCAILDPSGIDLEVGSCGLYVPGIPHDQELMGSVPAKVAGYEEDGPFTCSRCTHFISPSSCEGVAGKIEAEGCCNAWEAL